MFSPLRVHADDFVSFIQFLKINSSINELVLEALNNMRESAIQDEDFMRLYAADLVSIAVSNASDKYFVGSIVNAMPMALINNTYVQEEFSNDE